MFDQEIYKVRRRLSLLPWSYKSATRLVWVLGLLLITLVGSQPSFAEPQLTIEVKSDAQDSVERKLTLQQLEALPLSQFSTTTIWTDGEQHFEGVKLSTLLQFLDVEQGELILTAINDYSIKADIEDFQPENALLAFRRNGELMSARNKGPFWLVWNYDSDAEFRTEMIYALSIWQLSKIQICQNH